MIRIPIPQEVEASTKIFRGRIGGGFSTEHPKKGFESSVFHQVMSALRGGGNGNRKKGGRVRGKTGHEGTKMMKTSASKAIN